MSGCGEFKCTDKNLCEGTGVRVRFRVRVRGGHLIIGDRGGLRFGLGFRFGSGFGSGFG